MATHGLVTVGEPLIALRALDVGAARVGGHFELDVAGAESNVAIGASRLGVPARLIGRVGLDEGGDLISRTLRGEGVRGELIVDETASTGMLLATFPSISRSRVAYGRFGSAGSRLNASDVEGQGIDDAGVLHLTGITPALSESCRDAVLAAIRIAVTAQVPVVLDINYRSRLWSKRDAAEFLRTVLPSISTVFAGIEEASMVLDSDESDPALLARSLCALGPSEAIISDGGRGVWMRDANGRDHRQPAMPTEGIIDTTGAGDAFVAGYLAGALRGLPIATRLRTAAACGARVCEGRGEWRNALTRSEAEFRASDSNLPLIDR